MSTELLQVRLFCSPDRILTVALISRKCDWLRVVVFFACRSAGCGTEALRSSGLHRVWDALLCCQPRRRVSAFALPQPVHQRGEICGEGVFASLTSHYLSKSQTLADFKDPVAAVTTTYHQLKRFSLHCTDSSQANYLKKSWCLHFRRAC